MSTMILLSFHSNIMKIISKGLFKSIKEFKLLEKQLGSGSFGVVKLAIHRATGKFYAIKIVIRGRCR